MLNHVNPPRFNWIELLLKLDLNKNSLDEFMFEMLKHSNSRRTNASESEEELFDRVFIAEIRAAKGMFAPSYDLLYRLKYLTQINPAPLTLLLYNETLACCVYKFVQDRQKNASDIFSWFKTKPELAKQYTHYQELFNKTLDKEIKLNLHDFTYLQEIKNFTNGLISQFDALKAEENNWANCLYLALCFGEYLTVKFPDTEKENILKELKIYVNDLKDHTFSKMLLLQLAKQVCSMNLYAKTDPGYAVFQDFHLGVESFITLLGSRYQVNSSSTQEHLLRIEKYIRKDLIPHVATRKKFDAITQDLNSINHPEIKSQIKILQLKAIYQEYFAKYGKNDSARNTFKVNCQRYINKLKEIDSTPELETIIGKIEIGILFVVWIDPLLNIPLKKADLDAFIDKLIAQSADGDNNQDSSFADRFSSLFVFNLRKYENLFNPSDELLYRLKYLTLINSSLYCQMLLIEVVHCRAMFKINENRAVKIHYKNLDVINDKKTLDEYTQYCIDINDKLAHRVAANKPDSTYLEKVISLSAEFKRRLDEFKQNQNTLIICLYNFISLGEFLAEKFPDQNAIQLKEELKVYAHDFKDYEPIKYLNSFSLGQIAYDKLEKDLLPEQLKDFYIGLHGFLILLGIKLTHEENIDLRLLKTTCFLIEMDLILNAPARKKIDLLEFYGAEGFDNENEKASILKFLTNLRTQTYDYFLSPVKSEESIITLKKSFDEQMILTKEVFSSVGVSESSQKKWEGISTQAKQIILSIMAVAMDVKKEMNNRFGVANGGLFRSPSQIEINGHTSLITQDQKDLTP